MGERDGASFCKSLKNTLSPRLLLCNNAQLTLINSSTMALLMCIVSNDNQSRIQFTYETSNLKSPSLSSRFKAL